MNTPSSPVPYGPDRPGAGPYPVYLRPRSGRVVAGVAGGLAVHLRVDVFYVRLAFIIGSFLSGLGVAVYAGLWMFSKASEEVALPPRERELSRSVYLLLALVGGAGFVVSASFVSGLPAVVLVPLLLAGVGAVLAWQAYDRGLGSGRSNLNIFIGAVLMLAGIVVTIFYAERSGGFAAAIFAVMLTLAGAAALGVPLVVRLWDSLAEERAAKAASEERAEIASRLHDSVLQTLALIQKRSDDPAEVIRLARGQERELRQWLFDAEEKSTQSVFAAVETACGEVEDLFGVRIAPVTVGEDTGLTEDTKAVVLAAREAMVNAAKHAGVEKLDVYAEILAGELSIFVRDRGTGFDPADIPADRHGIRDSIEGRMERIGGQARIRSTEGEGTEVSVIYRLPVS
ncbi:ATP-binding protein [Corynebacterium comes]|uniref:Sensor histidine kinase LiaS n=1 Tax=Corynebacterium comes TaxID=2675218 RepID=A0A6B8VVX2_9CORY|nr:ATP-binding protein [Corynebacterium comes]QGU03827.1 Sensor histidine kinase LiaS [Corynebacterium comes]